MNNPSYNRVFFSFSVRCDWTDQLQKFGVFFSNQSMWLVLNFLIHSVDFLAGK